MSRDRHPGLILSLAAFLLFVGGSLFTSAGAQSPPQPGSSAGFEAAPFDEDPPTAAESAAAQAAVESGTATVAGPVSAGPAAGGRPTVQQAIAALPPVAGLHPVRVTVPSVGIDAPLLALGLNGDGTLQVPQPGPTYNDAAWFRSSPVPGTAGPSIILGHVDSALQGPSAFFTLGALKPGAQVRVALSDGGIRTFAVDSVGSYAKTAFPAKAVYAPTAHPALRLITCGGPFDRQTGHYLRNIVVFAHLVA